MFREALWPVLHPSQTIAFSQEKLVLIAADTRQVLSIGTKF
jgi:hypothetical protein